ncbi:PREDICTED: spore wall protein 2-like isoform X2 [Ipomoea nil]|uniref:spore wall protein 2-like isoform X2 n=1 Tax=Ipomoea nil TaxID=35883 RepID=UPI000900C46E|nr:PREDICTED: spore wall protein 2-like isoform X2 [Ipomoea nil]
MEVMSEKPRSNGGDDNKKGKKKTTKVELSLGKNGGIFILLGGALVTALISSAFRKHRKPPGGKDESRRESPAEESPEAGDEQKNNICEDEDPVRKGLQFILSDPSSLTQEHLRIKDDRGEGGDYNVRKEMTEEEKEEKRSLKIQAPSTEEQDSPAASGCNQEIISNGSSIPGSATSSEQEYSSHPFYTHPLFDQANSEDFRLTKMNETVEEEVKEVVPEEMECSEKNVSPEMEMDLCDGQDAAIIYSSPEIEGNDDQKNTNSEQVIITSEITHPESCETNVQNLDLAAFHVPLHINISNELSTTTKENGTTNEPEEEEEGEEVAGNDEEETNQNGTINEPEEEEEDKPIPTIQFVAEQPCNDYCEGGVSMADEKALGQYSSMDKVGEEVAGNDEEETNQNGTTNKPEGQEEEEEEEEEEDKPIPTTQFVAKQPCNDYCKGDVSMADEKALGQYSSMDKEGEEVADTDEEETNQNGTNEPEEEEDNQIPTIQFVAEQHCNDYCKGGVSMEDEKALGHYSSMDKEGEEVAGNDEGETNQNIEKTLGEDDTATAKQHPILPSNDKEGDEETTDDGNNECDYDEEYGYGDGDGDDDISEEMEESSEGVISSDESDDDGAIWPAEPAQIPLMGLKGPKEEIEDDNRTLKSEAYINLKTINNTKLQTADLRMNTIQASARKLAILDNLFAYSLQSKRTILAGTLTLLIAYSCFCYFELPFLKPSLVVIAAVFLSKVVLAG